MCSSIISLTKFLSLSTMALISIPILLIALLNFLFPYLGTLAVDGKVLMVLMEDDPVITYKANRNNLMNGYDSQKYKRKVISRHDIFLESLLPLGSYSKLYSYTHLLNGFAFDAASEETIQIIRDAPGVRVIQEDIKMTKMTTHTPDYLEIPTGVWPELGGAERAGEGVVIGMIDTGINPMHPSFENLRSGLTANHTKFKGKCQSGDKFPITACNGKIVGARYFARAAIAAGDFNATRDYASPYDADGHGSHTASTAAGNYRIAVLSNGYNYGYSSGMAPGAQIAVYKAVYSFGGYMSDVVAAVDKAVEDGVDILSLSVGPSAVPSGPAAFLNILEVELLFATKAGVTVIQAVGNGGPSASTILSFSPWITSVAASITDRKYNNSIKLGNGQSLSGTGLSGPTPDEELPIAAAVDVCSSWNASVPILPNCQIPEAFVTSLVRGKLIICDYMTDSFLPTSIDTIFDTIQQIGAAGVIIRIDSDVEPEPLTGIRSSFPFPGIILSTSEASEALMNYYSSYTVRGRSGVISFGATGRILEGRHATYTGQGPVVATYSSRGPDVNNGLMQTADVLKPSVMAPGTSIWAAWSSESEGEGDITGQDFALLSGTSMATPHVAGVAALIKHKHPEWSPAAIMSAMMTTADVLDRTGKPILAQQSTEVATGTPFDYGAGFINPTRAINPGLIFDMEFKNYLQFLCTVPGVDDGSVRRAVGVGCPQNMSEWCSDLNTASITVANLVGSRKVARRVTSVAAEKETYQVLSREPAGVAVNVTPTAFAISPNSSRGLKVVLDAREATDAYSFGEIVLKGDKNHVVRIPMAIFVSSALQS